MRNQADHDIVKTDEREAELHYKREYMRARREALVQVYFKDREERELFRKASEAAGYKALSKWIVQTLYNAMDGVLYPPGYVQRLEADLQKARKLAAIKDEQIVELQRDLRHSEAARDDLRVVLTAATERMPELSADLLKREAKRRVELARGGDLR